MNLYAINNTTKEKFLVVEYKMKVKEKGSDTDISLNKIVVYNPIDRYKFEIDEKDWKLVIEK